MSLLRHGQSIGLRPGLNHDRVPFRLDRGNHVQLAIEPVLTCQEYDPKVRQDDLAWERVCNVVIDRLTGAAARPERPLRDADADASGPSDRLRLRDIPARRREKVGRFAFRQNDRNTGNDRQNAALDCLKVLIRHIGFVGALVSRLLPGGLRPAPEAQHRDQNQSQKSGSMKNETKVARLRCERGLIQAALVKGTGVNIRTIQKFESGERGIETASLAVALRIADFLGVHPRELI